MQNSWPYGKRKQMKEKLVQFVSQFTKRQRKNYKRTEFPGKPRYKQKQPEEKKVKMKIEIK